MNIKSLFRDRRVLVIAAASVVLVAVLVLAFFLLKQDTFPAAPPSSPDGSIKSPAGFDVRLLRVTAENETRAGIASNSRFLVNYARDIPQTEMQQRLRIYPEQAFTLTKTGTGVYSLEAGGFESGSVVNVIAVDENGESLKSWAFQTETRLRLLSSLPADGALYVPIDSGIEFTFNFADIGEDQFERNFSIIPKISGRVEKYGKTLVFVPDSLAMDELYKVTLSGSLVSPSGGELGDDYTMSFRTQLSDRYDYASLSGKDSETFMTDQTQLIEISAGANFDGHDFSVTVYKYPSASDYASALFAYVQQKSENSSVMAPPTGGLSQVMQFADALKQGSGNSWGPDFLLLPEQLGQGCYLAEISVPKLSGGSGRKLYKFMQVSNLSVYFSRQGESGIVWINDTDIGKPISGAEVSLEYAGGDVSTKTGSGGLAHLEGIPQSRPDKSKEAYSYLRGDDSSGTESFYALLSVRYGSREFREVVDIASLPKNELQNSYYTYIYTDREMYQPSDNVRFWGIVSPRTAGLQPPEGLKAELVFYDGSALYSEPVTIDSRGMFSGVIKAEKLISSYFTLRVVCDGGTLCEKSVEFSEYEKPVYVIDGAVDRDFYFLPQKQKIGFSFSAEFFDGTPAEGLEASLHSSGFVVPKTIKINEAGSARLTAAIKDDYKTWRPVHPEIEFSNAQPESQSFYMTFRTTVLVRDVMVEPEYKDGTIEVRTSLIDASRIDTAEKLYTDFPSNIRGKPQDMPFSLELTRHYYVRTERSHEYDFVSKKEVVHYDYDPRTELIGTWEYATVGGKYVVTGLPPAADNEYYSVKITCGDTAGRPILEELTYGSWSSYYYYGPNNQYSLLNAAGNSYSDFDEGGLELSLSRDQDRIENKGSLLYFDTADGPGGAQVTGASKVDILFEERLVPGFQLHGAYFDGKHIYTLSPYYASYTPEKRELSVELKADRKSYSPGDTAKLTVTALRPDGAPAAGASVLVSVSDEAAFSIRDQSVDILRGLYSGIDRGGVRSFASFIDHSSLPPSMAEQGGEGGSDSLRRLFLDTAGFVTAVSDSGGSAEISIKLPDNLTSWRVTTLAAESGMLAGQKISNLIVTKPFFISPIVSELFLKGDEITVYSRGFGAGLKSGEKVMFKAELKGEGYTRKAEAEAALGGYALLKLGAPDDIGEYTLTLTASCKDLSDGIEKKLQIVETAMNLPLSKDLDLSAIAGINPARYPVVLGFYDKRDSLYFQVLSSVFSRGSRADQRLAERYAREMMASFGSAAGFQADEMSDVLNEGVRLFSYSEPDPEITALAAAAVPEYLNRGITASYLQGVAASRLSGATEVAAAYMGLAAMKEPVLGDLRYLLENPEKLGFREKLMLMTALALIGDSDGASKAYDALVTPNIVRSGSSESDFAFTVKSPSPDISDNQATAYALIAASVLRDENADAFARSLIRADIKDFCPSLMYVVYLKNYRLSPGEASFTYTSDGSDKRVTLGRVGTRFISFSKSGLEAANFKTAGGDVMAKAYYIGDIADAAPKENPPFRLKKTIDFPQGAGPGKNAVVTITPEFDSAALTGGYFIEDFIPAGMRFVSVQDRDVRAWSLLSRELQRVTFYYNRSAGVEPIVYTVKCTVPGTYVSDSAYISCAQNDMIGASGRAFVTIDE